MTLSGNAQAIDGMKRRVDPRPPQCASSPFAAARPSTSSGTLSATTGSAAWRITAYDHGLGLRRLEAP